MKQTAIIIFIFSTISAFGQVEFGAKGGLNYNANGNYFESIGDTKKNPDRNVGYHLGVYGKFGLIFFFRPELVFTMTKSDYGNASFDLKKIDAPLLLGKKIVGPVFVFLGPSLQYILDTNFEDFRVKDLESDFSVGLTFGAGVKIKKVGVDLRYERGLKKNEARLLSKNDLEEFARIDTRPDQFIVSLSLAF